MGNIALLDCTLRDGGYLNDWMFGEETVRNFGPLIAQTGVEFFEVGFVKPCEFNIDRTVYPDIKSMASVIAPKQPGVDYVAMIDMSNPISKDDIPKYDGTSVDAIRVIFKESNMDMGYDYCKHCIDMGYKTFVQFVGTDTYSDKALIDAVERFNEIEPFAMSVVDSFGMIKKKDFLRMVSIMDNNMRPEIGFGYHAHNNLQLAMSNTQALIEMNLERNVLVDASVFGMGRGSGNLNLELFAEYLNEERGKHYRIEPILEIMDRYLNHIYETRFWGYSLPLYLSASNGAHPNYAIYLAKKDTLSEKSFNELLKSIPEPDRHNFSKDKAEKYYAEYMENYVDDSETISSLKNAFEGRNILVLAPGASLKKCQDSINRYIKENTPVVVSLNFIPDDYKVDYIFSSNMRRYAHIQDMNGVSKIITSNIRDAKNYDYILNFSSYSNENSSIIDNSGLMLFKALLSIGKKKIAVAGMDGYTVSESDNYYNLAFEYSFPDMVERNNLIRSEINKINDVMKIDFITPSKYQD